MKPFCDFTEETLRHEKGETRVAGVDEAGRGPLAGPLVVAALIFPHGFDPALLAASKTLRKGLNDSKQLSHAAREKWFEFLTNRAELEYSVIQIDVAEIDRVNILEATRNGMRRSLQTLPAGLPEHALIDGLPVPALPCPQTALVGGDARSLSIAAASVLAKVTRDRLMLEADAMYPEFGFAKHKGYATARHLAMLRLHGPCPIHRRSFAPVAQLDFFR